MADNRQLAIQSKCSEHQTGTFAKILVIIFQNLEHSPKNWSLIFGGLVHLPKFWSFICQKIGLSFTKKLVIDLPKNWSFICRDQKIGH
jgi:hypothetical protein